MRFLWVARTKRFCLTVVDRIQRFDQHGQAELVRGTIDNHNPVWHGQALLARVEWLEMFSS